MKTYKITITEVEAQQVVTRRSSGTLEHEKIVLNVIIPEERNMTEVKAAILGTLYTQSKRTV
jgi:hypothetical protein